MVLTKGPTIGDTSVAEAARKHGLTVAEIEDWRDRFVTGAENALRSRPADEDGQKEREIKRLKQKVGNWSWISTS